MENISANVITTPQEKRLIILLKVVAAVYFIAVLGYLLPGLIDPMKNVFHPPFVLNSVVKIGLLAIVALFAAADVRRFKILISFLIFANILAVISGVLLLLFGNTSYMYDLMIAEYSGKQLLWGSMIADGIVTAFIIWFSTAAEASRYKLAYLTPGQFRTLTAVAGIVVTGDELVLSSEEVARNVDKYMSSFKARSKWITKVVLTGIYFYPLLSFNAPFPYMSREKGEKFIKKRFYQDVSMRLLPEFWRVLVQAMIRMAKQLSYLGYYNDKRTFASINFKPFSERMPALHNDFYPPSTGKLKVETSKNINAEEIVGDVVIIGSGAGASVMAHELAKKGREVLMLERGDYVDPASFNEDEIDMLSRLYADGALQLSRDFRFQVLQGSCVGGTTVVNNAVCFDLPDEVLSKWNSPPFNVSIDPAELKKSFKKVRDLISVGPMNNSSTRKDFLNHGAKVFSNGVEKLKLNLPPNVTMEVEANIVDCLGCGYCNIGCKYGKKMSMLDTVLPKIQKEYGDSSLRIIAGCEALKFKSNGKKVNSLQCKFSDGKKVEVKANTFIVAAGAVSSSILLLNSDIGKNAGKNLSFNMGSPITALFSQSLNSYDGLQISHYLKLSPNPGYIIETWYNPPVAQALTMPGWFEDHYNNMRKFDRLSCTGVLVPTESNGEVRRSGLTGREVRYIPSKKDMEKMLQGLMLSGEIFLAAGAESIMPATFKYHELRTLSEVKKLGDYVKDPSDITLGTGHPQGGNILTGNESNGVVSPEFKVFGYDNLYLCDASVFPTSVGVNPQLTVMALADYASRFVNGK